MPALNYKHLHYFWSVAKHGGVARAGERLHVTPQSISGQLRLLEESVGEPLFKRVGRALELTDMGIMVFEYAERMFSAGDELQEALREPPGARQAHFRVGVSNVVGRSLSYRILAPALALENPPRLICQEGKLADLLADLSVNRLDLVISDRPTGTALNVRGFNHLLGQCGVAFLATGPLAAKLKRGFPRSLDGAPMLLHGAESVLRQRLLRWLDAQGIRPRVVAEFDDTALLKAFGEEGAGAFVAPELVASQIARQFEVEIFGRTDEVIDQIYAISGERRITHRAVAAISDAARNVTFA
jgi:LysR family transcriptional activator of nhaA